MILIELFFVFMKIGVFTFGSGYAMLALAEKEVVELNQWLTAEQFADAVVLSEVTPGPIMINLATFVGVKQYGVTGAIMASLGLIIPPIIALTLITLFYMEYKDSEVVRRLFSGLRPAVIGLIITVVYKLGATTAFDIRSFLIAGLVIAAVFLGVHPILAVVASGLLGLLLW